MCQSDRTYRVPRAWGRVTPRGGADFLLSCVPGLKEGRPSLQTLLQPREASGQGQGPQGPDQQCVRAIFFNGRAKGLLNFSFLDDCPLKLPTAVCVSLGSRCDSPPVSYLVGDMAQKSHRETRAVSFFPNFPALEGKTMFGLKTEQLYHQPGPWMKSFPLKLNKQPQALLTPRPVLSFETHLSSSLPSTLGLP